MFSESITDGRCCAKCGSPLTIRQITKGNKYCGRKCGGSAAGLSGKRLPPLATCKGCNRDFVPVRADSAHCSRGCVNRTRKHVIEPPEARFAKYVNKTDGCWLWVGAVTDKGYGKLYIGRGRLALASRYSWESANGPIPDNLYVCHKCDTPLCVRPDHLFLGTQLDNIRDCVAKGRNARGDRHGRRKLSEEQVRAIRTRSEAGESQLKLSREYGVGPTQIRRIVTRQKWKHLV